ncbi:MAG: glycosyltransferase family 4 protein [Flavobacteriales bacterium]|nr:glycosyltransferase family 4 protein [Flavobacteriales bacterium]
MQKRSIVFFGVKYFPSRGGVSRVVESVINNLKDDYDITIYCYTHPKAADHIKGVKTIQFDEIPVKGIGVFLYLCKCYFHLMFKGKHDLVHLHKIDAAIFLPLLLLKFPKILATSHESSYLRDKWGPIAKTYFKLSERILVRSKATPTVISYPLSLEYERRFGRPVKFIPNGVEPLSDFGGSQATEIMQSHGIKKPYVAFAARRLMSTKGAHTMLKAFRKMEFEQDILIAGESNHTGSYVQELKNLSVGLEVKEVGFISHKPTLFDLIKNSELFIFPSETEGMSIMLLEVALLGIPIIASDIPENTAVFDNTQLTFFKDRDSEDLAEKIKWFYENRDTANHKANKAKEKVANQYSGKAMAGYYKAEYDRLLQSS